MTILPIQERKATDMEIGKRRMGSIPNRYGEEEPDSSSGIYVTTSLESECIFIA